MWLQVEVCPAAVGGAGVAETPAAEPKKAPKAAPPAPVAAPTVPSMPEPTPEMPKPTKPDEAMAPAPAMPRRAPPPPTADSPATAGCGQGGQPVCAGDDLVGAPPASLTHICDIAFLHTPQRHMWYLWGHP